MNAAIRHRQGPLAARSIFPGLGIPRVRKCQNLPSRPALVTSGMEP